MSPARANTRRSEGRAGTRPSALRARRGLRAPDFRSRPSGTAPGAARILLPILAAAFLGSCATVQKDLTVERLPEDAFAVLDAWERDLVLLESEPDRAALDTLRSRLAEAGTRPVLERPWSARLAALSGRAALLAQDRSAAERELRKALALNPADEVARVLEARLERNPEKRKSLLEAALGTAETQARLRAELGRTLSAEGRYAEALAAFDASLPFLPEAYERAYGAERRRALALRDASSTPGPALLSDKPASLQDLAALVQAESSLVDFLTGGRDWAPGILFERLRSGGFYPDPAAPGNAAARRGDAAFLLWRLAANKKNDRSLLTRYTDRYRYRPNPASPVPDVPLDSPWFDSVLGCVERDIMELPDGRNFRPLDPVSGLDFYRWLRRAADL